MRSSPLDQPILHGLREVVRLSRSESIPLEEIEDHIKQKEEEKKMLEEEIQKAGATLQSKNVDIHIVNQFKNLEEELRRKGLTMKSPCALISILEEFRNKQYDPVEIVAEISCVKSLRHRENQLKKSCEMFESKVAQYNEILPICREIVSFGIGFPELAAFHAAVMKKVNLENLPFDEAAYALMNDIDTPGRKAELEKQLNDLIMKIQMVKLVLARQNDAIVALAKLQYYGISESQILHLCKTIEANDHKMNGAQAMNLHT